MNEKIPASPDNCGNRIGILIVAYNAVTTIAKVLKRIPADVWSNVEEVVIFDDASRDHTYELAVGFKMLSKLEKLTVLKNENNLGYGGNQKLGYSYFIQKEFDVAILLHGDGQYAPEILADMYAPIVNGGADAVFGSRMMPHYGGPLKGGMPIYKLVGNRILTYLENYSLGLHFSEFHSGYRAYSLAALRRIDMTMMTNDFHFDTQIIIKLHHQGFRIKEIPIPTYYGNEICYVNGLKYAWDVFQSVIRYNKTIRSLKRCPEYAEYFVHYPIKESKHSSYYYFRRWVGEDQDVLDIGCGEGFFAQVLAAGNNRVTGIDILENPKCMESFTEYLYSDLDSGLNNCKKALDGKTFDRILFQDILEHVRNPVQLLIDCHDLLKPNGLVLVSVPNVANITVRLSLLFGWFNYAERGILDKTHVRFFTRKTAGNMLTEAGYKIETTKMTIIPIELALAASPSSLLMRAANRLMALLTSFFPGLFGYQILFVARSQKTGGS